MYTLITVFKKRLIYVAKPIILATLLFVFTSTKALASEYISDYKVYIKLQESGLLEVSELITVNSEGAAIKRGIYRDFPTKYKTNSGYNKNTTFDIIEVTKNGEIEPYHTEKLSNGKRLYIGSSDVFLTPGLYTYGIKYNTNYQVGYFNESDELYYNAIGAGWAFPIYSASALIELPASFTTSNLDYTAYTGSQGSRNTQNVSISSYTDGVTTKILYVLNDGVTLNPYEGFTVVASFPKGLVKEPSRNEQIIRFIKDNLYIIILILSTLLGLVLVPGIYLYYWLRHGRDPKTRGVVRNYDIPKKVSPAAARYIADMKFDNKALSTTIISLAVKRFLTIKEDKKLLSKKFTLIKETPKIKTDLYQDELAVYEYLFSGEKTKYVFDKKDYKKNQALIEKLKISVEKENKEKYVLNNYKYSVVPILVTIILFLIGGFNFILLLILVPVHIFFHFALKARTKAGKEIYDQIMGLKEYLSAVEEPRYTSNLHKEIPFNIGVYEKYLPYAVALNVEPLWSKRLKNYIDTLQDKSELKNHMLWYAGSRNAFDPGFANSFTNSLNSSVTSASTAPGSSSGFSGGSSGGGGGGGGGGGW